VRNQRDKVGALYSVRKTVGVDDRVSQRSQQAATSQLHSWLSELEEQERSYDEDED
jgi:hypothetical protein